MKIICYLILSIIVLIQLNASEVPVQKVFQPKSLTSLAAEVIAQNIDPARPLTKTIKNINPSLIRPEVAPHVAFALAKRNEKKLYDILKSQTPLTIQINDFEQYPENIYSLEGNSGLYVRQRKEAYHPDGKRRFYPGIAQLIPNPITIEQNAPITFFQVYSNPQGTKFFSDDDKDGQWREDENNIGICIWDRLTGACLNNGSVIKEKLRERYPQLAKDDPYFPDLMLYGLSSDDRIAWTRFVYILNRHVHEGLCAFDIENNTIVKSAINERLIDVSHSGRIGIIEDQNNYMWAVLTNNPSCVRFLAGSNSDTLEEIAPCDNYLITRLTLHNGRLYPTILHIATRKSNLFTIQEQAFSIYCMEALSSDGKLLAIKKDDTGYIFNISPDSNHMVHTIPLPELEHSIYRLLFSPANTKLLALKIQEPDEDTTRYSLKIFDITTKECVQELTEQEIAATPDLYDYIFCNNGEYLLLPNGQLFMQPQALLNHLNLQQLLALLTLEHIKSQNSPLNPALVQFLQHAPAKIRELVAKRYAA